MLYGYLLTGMDNDSYIFDPNDETLATCNNCHFVVDYDHISPTFKLNIKKYDISSTYDGRTIVSEKLKNYLLENYCQHVSFVSLPNDSQFYKMNVSNILQIDSNKTKLRFGKFYDQCGHYESVNPTLPIIFKGGRGPLSDGIYATDIFFGSRNGKAPMHIIGKETYNKLKPHKFKGISFMRLEM